MLISEEYSQLNARLHRDRPDYGAYGYLVAPVVRELCSRFGYETVLDYGCGKGDLAAALPALDVRNYDPAIEKWNLPPLYAEFVVCVDVLEHVEPDCIEDVVADLARLTLGRCFVSIACKPAFKFLPDGRNTHLIVRPHDWWLALLGLYFQIERQVPEPGGLGVLMRPRVNGDAAA